ncbi:MULTISPECIES: AMP-binding protein [unclassified Pseudomonas]|uniref:AMP-binding protein n=1 Tax=unclassified Pseudomonas TaxID=196821 RepID=UPI001912E80D|nr:MULTISPECIES: AMP-binding protein [unclassified Pseudomonas]MBK5550369.1 AMP-binding protein [Pseudomonas sp. TH03]MEB0223951.1 AMP-binding protein [Pseudomonas sp. 5S1]MEB0297011.1 AMP-binding protein [Pseudomonas sp. 10S4]WPX21286.1 AMP-binding protein [Pseudomonas sp. 10S4]
MSARFIADLRQALQVNRQKVCAIDCAPTGLEHASAMTYGELESRALNLAAELQRRFDTPAHGDHVVLGIATRNSSDWLIADLACLFAGITALPLPLAFSQSQAEHLAERCDGFLVDAAGERTLADRWMLDFPDSRLRRISEPALEQSLLRESDGSDWICKIIHTSGTTSRPKGVRLSTAAVGAVLTSLRQWMPVDAHRSYLSLVPLSLLLEQVTAAYLPLLAGGIVYFLPEGEPLLGEPGTSPQRLIEWILRVEPTALTVPPVMLNRFYEQLAQGDAPGKRLSRYLHSGVHITCGGAAVSLDILNALAEDGIPVFQGYGLSENASVVSMNTLEHQRLGSVGKPLPHVQVRIGADQTIEVKSSSLFSGYSGKDPSACSMSDDGWMDTGDLGELDADGYLYVRGRKKNVICLPNGRNVSPEQVELEYREYPGVRDAAVFFDETHGLVALLCVESAPDRADLSAWSTQRFSDIERPSHLWLLTKDDPLLEQLYTVTGRPKRADIATVFSDLQRTASDEHACLSL